MLYQTRKTSPATVLRWIGRALWLRPAHQVTDIRELSPYLRADIGAPSGSHSFRV